MLLFIIIIIYILNPRNYLPDSVPIHYFYDMSTSTGWFYAKVSFYGLKWYTVRKCIFRIILNE